MIKFIKLNLLVLLFFFISCKDNSSTSVSGKVIDAITGDPVPNVAVSLHGETDSYPYKTISDFYTTKTNGNYNLSINGEYLTVTHMFAEKNDYVKFGDLVEKGKSNIRNIIFRPLDSSIKFNIVNSKMLSDSFWGFIDYKGLLNNELSIGGTLLKIIPKGTSYSKTFKIPGNDFIYIRWGYKYQSTFYDSIYVKSGDSVDFNIIM